jgi:hypothetical protein
MSQVLAVGAESLVAGFAPGDDDTCSTECNRHVTLDERAPNVPFEFGLRFLKNPFLIHRTTIPYFLISACRSAFCRKDWPACSEDTLECAPEDRYKLAWYKPNGSQEREICNSSRNTLWKIQVVFRSSAGVMAVFLFLSPTTKTHLRCSLRDPSRAVGNTHRTYRSLAL